VSKSGADIFPIKLTAGTNYKVPSNILKTRETICFRTIGSLKRERQTKWCLYIDSYSMLSAEVRAELMVSIYRLLLYETVKTMPRARKNFCFDQYEEQPKAVNDSSESGQNSIIIVIALSLSTLIFVLTTQTYCHIPNVPNVTKTGGNANERCTFPTQGFSQRGGSTRKFPGPSFRQLLKQTS